MSDITDEMAREPGRHLSFSELLEAMGMCQRDPVIFGRSFRFPKGKLGELLIQGSQIPRNRGFASMRLPVSAHEQWTSAHGGIKDELHLHVRNLWVAKKVGPKIGYMFKRLLIKLPPLAFLLRGFPGMVSEGLPLKWVAPPYESTRR